MDVIFFVVVLPALVVSALVVGFLVYGTRSVLTTLQTVDSRAIFKALCRQNLKTGGLESASKKEELEQVQSVSVSVEKQVPLSEVYADVPGLGLIRKDEYETRADGKFVRKDRWETGMRNIAGILTGPRAGFEIEDVVEKVRVLAQAARADYESGGNGVPGSAPKWGPCPAECANGQVRGKWDEDCPTCEGRGKVVIEPPTAPATPRE